MFTSNLEIKNEAIIGSIEMPRVSAAMQGIDVIEAAMWPTAGGCPTFGC